MGFSVEPVTSVKGGASKCYSCKGTSSFPSKCKYRRMTFGVNVTDENREPTIHAKTDTKGRYPTVIPLIGLD